MIKKVLVICLTAYFPVTANAEIYAKMTIKNSCVFLKNLIAHFSFKIHKIWIWSMCRSYVL